MLNDVLKELQVNIDKGIEAFKRDLTKVRTGRANLAILDGVRVDYYGQLTPISQMATISVPEARLLTVKPWDKSQVQAVEKAIRESDLGLNPQVDGELIRIPIPSLSEERRRDLVKVAKKHGEECKVGIRKARHDALDLLAEMKQAGEASEDAIERAKKRAEELVGEAGQKVDQIIQSKEKDILAI